MNRQQRRAMEKKGISEEEVKLSDKIFLFNKLPDQCTTCENPFDKQDRKMLFSWKVVIRDEAVRLFCPSCIENAKTYIEENIDGNL